KCEVNMRFLFLSGFALFTAGYYFMDLFVDFMNYEEQKLGKSSFVESKGCRIMTITSEKHDVESLWGYTREDFCDSHLHLKSFSKDDKNYLWRRMVPEFLISMIWSESLRSFKCKYHAVKRHSDYDNQPLYVRKFGLTDEYITIEPIADIIRAECFYNGTRVYNGVHFYVRPPDKRQRSSLGLPPLKPVSDPESLSVLIVGLDSFSQLHFARSMPQTANFLRSLPHVELQGFHRLGNTFESLMPLLSGLSGSEMANFSSKLGSLDTCPFIWKEFRRAGYETALGEDNIDKSMFPEQGFKEPPTDNYLRPALIEMWLKTRRDRSHGTHCNEADSYAMVLRDFFYKVIPRHQRYRLFTFLWWTQGIDHLFNYGRSVDTMFLEMFQLAARSGLLKSTLLLVVSNHGLTKGYFHDTVQGKAEEDLPMALLCFPKWMEERFPRAIANLKGNNYRLVTAFDLHATLLDLPNLSSIKDKSVEQRSVDLATQGENLPRGISLFLPVPSSRDCGSAQVPRKYCLCHEQARVSTMEGYVLQAALLIVRTINRALHKHIPPCHKLFLKLVLDVDEWRRPTDENHSELLVRLLATPGDGQFEGVVRYTSRTLTLNGPILRTNEYGNDSYCIDNYLINMYCYCS
ncbi:hypothetical protein KR054_012204, partial [Drosophila jambulina]